MLTYLGLGVLLLLPIIVYTARTVKTSTPSLQWPSIGKVLGFQFADKPARLMGDFERRHVAVELHNGAVIVTMQLSQPSRLRVEVGDRAEVTRRSGMIVPDPVVTGDSAFEQRLLARCSDKNAGLAIFEPALRGQILQQPIVDCIGVGDKVQWKLPELKDPGPLEEVLQVMTAISAEMERYPANA